MRVMSFKTSAQLSDRTATVTNSLCNTRGFSIPLSRIDVVDSSTIARTHPGASSRSSTANLGRPKKTHDALSSGQRVKGLLLGELTDESQRRPNIVNSEIVFPLNLLKSHAA